ncbi:MAG: sialate O-acetylesterase [Armatimonadota bacterium]
MALELHPLHSDHAVLQRGVPIPIRGTDRPGAEIRVAFGGAVANAHADREGHWSATLPPMPAEARGRALVVEGTTRIERRNVLVGDLWLCSGQSNMEWSLGACDTPEVLRAADLPLVRHFGVGMRFAATPQATVRGEWRECTPGTAGEFTAVGFHFARRVAAETGVPVGILRSAVGGTNIECWMARETLLRTPALEPFARRMRASWARYQAAPKEARPALDAWSERARAAEAAGHEIPQPPIGRRFPTESRHSTPAASRCTTA